MEYEYDSDVTNSVLKWGNSQTNYFLLVDAMKVVSFLRFSLSENSLYCPWDITLKKFG